MRPWRRRGASAASDRAFALAALVPYLDEPSRAAVVREALEAARAIGDETDRARALTALRPTWTSGCGRRSLTRPWRRRGPSGTRPPGPS